MKPGDVVTLRHDRVSISLLSDATEKITEVRTTLIGDFIAMRRGEVATVLEVNQQNKARVKIFYKSGAWWGNVSDMYVIE